jgi:hypothetical protein
MAKQKRPEGESGRFRFGKKEWLKKRRENRGILPDRKTVFMKKRG